jgi:hypothetical protein
VFTATVNIEPKHSRVTPVSKIISALCSKG